MSKSKRHTKKVRNQRRAASPASAIAKGLAVSLISAVLLITLSAVLLCATADPGRLTLPAALVCLYLSSFAGGLAASLSMGGDTPCGIFCGVAYFTIILLLSLVLPHGASEKLGMGLSVALHAATPLFALLGGLAATNALNSRARRKRRR